MNIQAAVLHAPSTPLTLQTLELGALRDDEVLVEVVATGVCHTDISMIARPFPVDQPIVLGHEGAGIVRAIGTAVGKVAVGDPVVMSFDFCGHCNSCTHHAVSYCHDFFGRNFLGQRADGSSPLSLAGQPVRGRFFGQSSFASHCVSSERNVVKVPLQAPLELLGPLGCGMQTGAGAVINVLQPKPGQTLAVFGAGAVGMAAIMAARAMGITRIVAIDRIAERLTLARELGASHTVQADAQLDVVAEVRTLLGGAGADFSFDTTGVMPVLRQALDALAPRGVCGFVGGSPVGSELAVDVRDVMIHGKTLRGIIEGDSNADVLIPALIEWHAQGRFPFDRLVTFYRFDQLNQAIEDSRSGRSIKPVVRMAAGFNNLTAL